MKFALKEDVALQPINGHARLTEPYRRCIKRRVTVRMRMKTMKLKMRLAPQTITMNSRNLTIQLSSGYTSPD